MLLAKFCLYDWALVLVELYVFSIEMLHMDLFGQVRERERERERERMSVSEKGSVSMTRCWSKK